MKSSNLYIYLLLIVCIHHQTARADVFTAIYKIKELTEIEHDLLTSLQTYIEAREANDKPVEDKLKEFLNKTRTQNKFHSINTTYPEHPINAYRMISRIYNSWETLIEEVNCPDCEWNNYTEAFVKKFNHVQESLWPTEKDIKGAALAIFRIVNMYRLNVSDVIQGNISTYMTTPMNTEEVFQLNQFASDENMLYTEISWLLALYQLFKDGRIEKGIYNLGHIDRAIAGAYNRYDMPWESLKYIGECLEILPDNKACQRDKNFYEMKLKSIPVTSRDKKLERTNKSKDASKYAALCRGDKRLSEYAISRQKCFFRPMSAPYELAKEEVISYSPRIAMYYDIITPSEIQHIQDLTKKKLLRSRVIQGDNDQANSEWMRRVSQSAWVWDSDNIIRKITRRIEKITGLDTQLKVHASFAEPFQVLNYGIGGMYEPHFDYVGKTPDDRKITKMLRNSGGRMANWVAFGNAKVPDEVNPVYLHGAGDRLATWLIYLSDVSLGGATVFPKINIRVPVVKGAAAFWYNYNKKHFNDPRTEHAGCPVVVGSKWVSNKWFRENGQTFRRLCGLKKNDIDH